MSRNSGKKFRLVSLVAVAAIALTTFGASASAASTTQPEGSSATTITEGDASYIPEPLQGPEQGQALWEKYLASQKKPDNKVTLVTTTATATLDTKEIGQLREYVGSDNFLDNIHKLSKEDLRILKELLRSK